MLRGWGCAACCLYLRWTAGGAGGESRSRTMALRRTNVTCIPHDGGATVDPQRPSDRLPEAAFAHELAEMDSLPAQSVRPRLKRSPRRPAAPQPLIWIGCAIWIAKRPADRLMHNSKEQAERAAYLGVNSLYFPCNGARPPTRPLKHNVAAVIRRFEIEETTPIDVTSCRFKHTWPEVFCTSAEWFSTSRLDALHPTQHLSDYTHL